ncbi:hypothetical protein Micbo1qcDRAFT_167746, partial [Microdochium bolleyi]
MKCAVSAPLIHELVLFPSFTHLCPMCRAQPKSNPITRRHSLKPRAPRAPPTQPARVGPDRNPISCLDPTSLACSKLITSCSADCRPQTPPVWEWMITRPRQSP